MGIDSSCKELQDRYNDLEKDIQYLDTERQVAWDILTSTPISMYDQVKSYANYHSKLCHNICELKSNQIKLRLKMHTYNCNGE